MGIIEIQLSRLMQKSWRGKGKFVDVWNGDFIKCYHREDSKGWSQKVSNEGLSLTVILKVWDIEL